MREYVTIFFELIIGFGVLFFYMKALGKSHFAKLTPFDFVSVLVLGDLLGNAIYDDRVHIGKTSFAIVVWGLLIWILEIATQKWARLRKPLEGEPSVIIRNGTLLYDAMKKNKLDLNQLQTLLRQQGYFSLQKVEYAVWETNGALSVLAKAKYDTPGREELGLPDQQTVLPVSLILDGKLIRDNLRQAGIDERKLLEQIGQKGASRYEDVFYAEWNGSDSLYIATYK